MTKMEALLTSLVDQCPWLSCFAVTSDQVLADIMKKATDDFRPSNYDHFQYDKLLSEASNLLDRCLAYRKDYDDLFANAIRQAIDYRVYNSASAAQEEIEKAPWIAKIKEYEASGQRDIAESFEKDGSPLSHPFALASQKAAELAEWHAQSEMRRSSLISERWKSDHKQKNDIQDSFNLEGSPLNYNDRSSRVLRLLKQDFYEAVQKLIAAKRGLWQIFYSRTSTPNNPLFPVDPIRPLDELVHWARKQIRLLDYDEQFYDYTENVYSLRSFYDNRPEAWQKDPMPFDKKLNTYSFDVPFNFAFLNTYRVCADLRKLPNGINSRTQPFGRIVSVGASIVLKDQGSVAVPSSFQVSCNICPPYQDPDDNIEESWFDTRDEVNISTVRIDDGQPAIYSSSTSIRNISARGIWRLDISYARYPFGENQINLPDVVFDVRLHIITLSPKQGPERNYKFLPVTISGPE